MFRIIQWWHDHQDHKAHQRELDKRYAYDSTIMAGKHS